jgi:hypothetical protein
VASFVEKPAPSLCLKLRNWGGLWNSLILTARGVTLLRLLRSTLPGLVDGYLERRIRRGEVDSLLRIHTRLEQHDFSTEVLQRAPHRLHVMEVLPCGWCDLGTPARLMTWLSRRRGMPAPTAACSLDGR